MILDSSASMRSASSSEPMIVADEMEKSMGDEMAIVVGERRAEFIRLTRQRLVGKRDIAERDGFPEAAGSAAGTRARWSACRRRASAGSARATRVVGEA